jgi:hypothetical protein
MHQNTKKIKYHFHDIVNASGFACVSIYSSSKVRKIVMHAIFLYRWKISGAAFMPSSHGHNEVAYY